VRGEEDDDPSIVRHLHDLAPLSNYAMEHKTFKTLAMETIAHDDARSKKIAGLSLQDKFATVLTILKEDEQYEAEYKLFVMGMSYANANNIPSYATAIQQIQQLIDHVLAV